ncbi:hypothetical protein, partial [Burkholderia lata]|uniref:hypothetical protein n=1 Tax=Burkholderia lata (strain ATCC 17760 / DSM 23089 / LMG 22485 / NCIMB 9086 / R18194 / 383) TaxID=482957 RepID=UPI001583CF80
MTQRIARHSDPDTTIALAQATRATRSALGPENAAAVFERNASAISTGQAFHGAVARLPQIPENFRDGPLSVLGRRILQIPPNQQQAALDAWLPVAQQQRSRSALLNDLVLAGAERPAGLRQGPNLAVQRGENVQAVAQRHGITTPTGIHDLEQRAIHSNAPTSAGSAVIRGENVQAVAQRHGITTPEGIHELEQTAIRWNVPTSAGSAVIRGENVQAVAQRHGITT